MLSRRLSWTAAAALLAGLCGCESATEPSSVADPRTEAAGGYPSGTVLRLVSGEDGTPVAGAVVRLAGREARADSEGAVTLTREAALGTSLRVDAAGFLTRRTLLRSADETTFALWPSESPTGLDADYTEALVYTSAALGNTSDREALDRPGLDTPFVSVLPDDAIRSDGIALENLRAAAAELSAATGAIAYRLDAAPGSTPVTFAIDPEDETIVEDNLRAFTRCWLDRLVITRCEVVLRSLDVARSPTVLHELGHSFGLNHSPDAREIMGVRRLSSPSRFSPRERLVMRLMLTRRPGNLFPDDDRQAPSLRQPGSVSRVVCRHP